MKPKHLAHEWSYARELKTGKHHRPKHLAEPSFLERASASRVQALRGERRAVRT